LATCVVACLTCVSAHNAQQLIPGGDFMSTTVSPLDANQVFSGGATPFQLPYQPQAGGRPVTLGNKTYSTYTGMLVVNVDEYECSTSTFNASTALEATALFAEALSESASSPFGFATATASEAAAFFAGASASASVAMGGTFCVNTAYELTMPTAPMVNDSDFTAPFVAMVNALPSGPTSYAEDPKAWWAFAQTYGYWIPQSCKVGAVGASLWWTSSTFVDTYGALAFQASMEASMAWTAAGGASGSGGGGGATAVFLNNSANSSNWAGGTCTPPLCSEDEWRASVLDNAIPWWCQFSTITDFIARVSAGVAEGADAAFGNITAITSFQDFLGPGLTNLAAWTAGAVRIDSQAACEAGPSTLAGCDSNKDGQPVCCSVSYSGAPYPNATAIAALNETQSTNLAIIAVALEIIANASSTLSVTPSEVAYVTGAYEGAAKLRAGPTTQATCTVLDSPSGQNGSPYCPPSGCSWDGGRGQCVCNAGTCYGGCQANSGQNFCPPVCGGSAPVAVATYTASWPAGFA
jgi:hypothetical protein